LRASDLVVLYVAARASGGAGGGGGGGAEFAGDFTGDATGRGGAADTGGAARRGGHCGATFFGASQQRSQRKWGENTMETLRLAWQDLEEELGWSQACSEADLQRGRRKRRGWLLQPGQSAAVGRRSSAAAMLRILNTGMWRLAGNHLGLQCESARDG
jgi:hypothetical protein